MDVNKFNLDDNYNLIDIGYCELRHIDNEGYYFLYFEEVDRMYDYKIKDTSEDFKIGDKCFLFTDRNYQYLVKTKDEFKILKEKIDKKIEEKKEKQRIEEMKQFLKLSREEQMEIVLEDLIEDKLEEKENMDSEEKRDFNEEYGRGRKGVEAYFDENIEEVENELDDILEKYQQAIEEYK